MAFEHNLKRKGTGDFVVFNLEDLVTFLGKFGAVQADQLSDAGIGKLEHDLFGHIELVVEDAGGVARRQSGFVLLEAAKIVVGNFRVGSECIAGFTIGFFDRGGKALHRDLFQLSGAVSAESLLQLFGSLSVGFYGELLAGEVFGVRIGVELLEARSFVECSLILPQRLLVTTRG